MELRLWVVTPEEAAIVGNAMLKITDARKRVQEQEEARWAAGTQAEPESTVAEGGVGVVGTTLFNTPPAPRPPAQGSAGGIGAPGSAGALHPAGNAVASADVPTDADAVAAVTDATTKRGVPMVKIIELLQREGVTKVPQLTPEARARFVANVRAATV